MEQKTIEVDIQNEALALINDERIGWENSVAFVTDRVAFNMRNLIKELRKNYWGIFQEPIDPISGRKKIWIPLTQSIVDSVIKNYDIDTKDICIRSKKAEWTKLTSLVRGLYKENLDKIYFGEHLDEMERTIGIDGTAVWKVIECKDDDGLYTFDIIPVDLLNFYIDPLARSINDKNTLGTIERAICPVSWIEKQTDFINKKDLVGKTNIHPTDSLNVINDTQSKIEMRVLNERYGWMPKSFITGLKKDKDKEVFGRITASGVSDKMEVIHLIEEMKFPKKMKPFRPYEEFWYQRVPGRWYGRGPAEMVMMLQVWMNIIVNIRINRSYVNQLGLFKVKKGSGITAQMLSRLSANGVIQVQDMQDIEQMAVQEASQASYNDEGSIKDWAQRVTQAFEVVTGETMPSSTTATVGAIQSRNALNSFAQIQKGLGMSLQRFLKRQVLPIIKKNLKMKEGVAVELEPSEARDLIDFYAKKKAYIELKKLREKGQLVTPELIEREIAKAKDAFKDKGNVIYWKDIKDVDLDNFDVYFDITNESIDKNVIVQNLIASMQFAPELKDQVMPIIFDLLGQNFKPVEAPIMPQPIQGQPQPVNSMVDQLTNANITK